MVMKKFTCTGGVLSTVCVATIAAGRTIPAESPDSRRAGTAPGAGCNLLLLPRGEGLS